MKVALAKAVTVLAPSYAVAWFTGEMVYVVPTLAAAGFVASAVGNDDIKQMVDTDTDTDVDNGTSADPGESGAA
jgi:hypothetical protein